MTMQYRRTVLMGDPTHFSVLGGANPHTRTRWGTRRLVDRDRAIAQWNRLKDCLEDKGIRVIVVPPDAQQPGLVYPANAGFQSDVDAELPLESHIFTLSNLLPTRAGEKQHYREVLRALDIQTREIESGLRFEGEADFFPVDDLYLLTHGAIERQRFVPRFGIPPWKRIYGFRTDRRVEEELEPMVIPKEILRIELVLEAHYHGDTALCAFGSKREHLLVYRAALQPDSYRRLSEKFGPALIDLDPVDAVHYAANSFTFSHGTDAFLFMPQGVSDRLVSRIRERGVTPVQVDVSEFLKKGGGSVKCMIGDLGVVGTSPAS